MEFILDTAFTQCKSMYAFQFLSQLNECVWRGEVWVVGFAKISSDVISWQNGRGVPCCGKACEPLV